MAREFSTRNNGERRNVEACGPRREMAAKHRNESLLDDEEIRCVFASKVVLDGLMKMTTAILI